MIWLLPPPPLSHQLAGQATYRKTAKRRHFAGRRRGWGVGKEPYYTMTGKHGTLYSKYSLGLSKHMQSMIFSKKHSDFKGTYILVQILVSNSC
jgi:hypothetical protein